MTLQFLKSAIYYFLTDKDNSRGHLRAIESILGYTDSERYNIDKVAKWKAKINADSKLHCINITDISVLKLLNSLSKYITVINYLML